MNMNDCKISVYITSYNQKEYLEKAIDSVLNQTLRPFEILIIDDCSTDGSQDLISKFESEYSFIRAIYHQENIGITRTRNQALDLINGDYVTYLDGDDRFISTKLEDEYLLMSEYNDVMIVFSNYFYIDANGNRISLWADKIKPPEGNIFKEVFCRNFPRNNIFRNELINTKALNEIHYDNNLNIYEDWDFRIRLTKEYNAVYCNKLLSEYRIHEGGLSRSNPWKHKYAFEYIFAKNEYLLEDLSKKDKQKIQSRFNHFITKFSEKIAIYEIDTGELNKISGALLYLELIKNKEVKYIPTNLIFRVLLPTSIYRLGKRMIKKMKRHTKNIIYISNLDSDI